MTLPPLDLPAWLRHFRRNATRPPQVPWDDPYALTDMEFHRIAHSIATFQLGEQSEGHALRELARHFAARSDAALLPAITTLFVQEEQLHAALLARFMEQQGIPRLRRQWTDRVFRRLRRLGGFELAITVLTTAEVLALRYYPALRAATGSEVLRAICTRLLADERAHVHYESQLLHALRRRRGPRAAARSWARHRRFCIATAFVVWMGHRRVLRPAYGSWRHFAAAVRSEFADFEALGAAFSPAAALESALRYAAGTRP
ncbi:MAG: hypothetical protein U1F11_02895 [Steroidobacteraceae bacterium]